MNKIKIIIADDHSMLRYGISQILSFEKEFDIVGQASNGQEAIDLAIKLHPDIILMDINMPVLSGIQALQKLREINCQSKVIMLTIHEDKEYLFKTLQMGAQGYVLKDCEPNVLINAIKTVMKGQNYINGSMTNELVKEFNKVTLYEKGNRDNGLTARELDVLKLIAEGMLNKEIANSLGISEKTVKNHVSNIFKKINVYDRTQAAIYAFKHDIKS